MHNGEVLVVDDTIANLEVVGQILEDAGYEIATALSGDRALKLIKSHPPDLVLLDIQMPGISGFETCQQIKQDPQAATIPVIFMTALSDMQSKVKGFELGAVDYITKPFQEKELLARVNTHVVLRQLNKHLEARVDERTEALQTALAQLNESHLQLVQSEKMSALGNLVAGIAHEMNNPLGFITGSIQHAHNHAQDVLEHLKLYQTHCPNAEPIIQENAEEIDLDFLVKDLPHVLSTMKEAAHRLKDLSQSLRTFSRTDHDDATQANLHESIDSTLLILKYRLQGNEHRSKIDIVRNYSDIPTVQCFPGQLNQVFMNILANAIDMFDEMGEQALAERSTSLQSHSRPHSTPTITITTKATPTDTVLISIQDNGKGMTATVKDKIFDRAFTTKAVGKGTGIGLAISRQIIEEKHSGTLTVESEVGNGSTFNIHIPYST